MHHNFSAFALWQNKFCSIGPWSPWNFWLKYPKSVFSPLLPFPAKQVTQVDACYNADQLSQIGHHNGLQMGANAGAGGGQANNVGAYYFCFQVPRDTTHCCQHDKDPISAQSSVSMLKNRLYVCVEHPTFSASPSHGFEIWIEKVMASFISSKCHFFSLCPLLLLFLLI